MPCVIIFMKYRFGTINQLSGAGEQRLTFSLLNKAIHFAEAGSMAAASGVYL